MYNDQDRRKFWHIFNDRSSKLIDSGDIIVTGIGDSGKSMIGSQMRDQINNGRLVIKRILRISGIPIDAEPHVDDNPSNPMDQ